MNGYVRIKAYRWNYYRKIKYLSYIYEGKIENGILNYSGFGRLINGFAKYNLIGWFDGRSNGKALVDGQFIFYKEFKL